MLAGLQRRGRGCAPPGIWANFHKHGKFFSTLSAKPMFNTVPFFPAEGIVSKSTFSDYLLWVLLWVEIQSGRTIHEYLQWLMEK